MICYVVCSGPSLKFFDFNELKDKHCIAVNYSVLYLPRVVALVAIDSNYYKSNFEYLKKANIPMYSVKGYDPSDEKKKLGVIELKNAGVNGYERGEGIRHGFNSGYVALGLAIKKGYTDIRVLGMDLTDDGHFWENKKTQNLEYVIKHLMQLKKELPEGVKITFYGRTNAKMFENKPLSECLI